MEQKKKDKDVLIVRDEKTGEISVVAGLDKDGNPKRTPAKAENAQDFLQFDRHGDVILCNNLMIHKIYFPEFLCSESKIH